MKSAVDNKCRYIRGRTFVLSLAFALPKHWNVSAGGSYGQEELTVYSDALIVLADFAYHHGFISGASNRLALHLPCLRAARNFCLVYLRLYIIWNAMNISIDQPGGG